MLLVEALFKAKCPCRFQTTHEYQEALYNIKVWPLELTATRTSIDTLLRRLRNFEYVAEHAVSDGSRCEKCCKNYKSKVKLAVYRVRHYFQGLCLHCMDRTGTRAITRDEDEEYWRHQSGSGPIQYDVECDVVHGKNTWYHSFMGRSEKPNVV